MKIITVLGSTGSIGKQVLEVIRKLKYRVFGISCLNNFEILKKQIREFKPEYALIANDKNNGKKFSGKIGKTKILYGQGNFQKLISHQKVDIVVNALVGAAGILPSILAIKAKKDFILANKESLVCAGPIIMELARKNKVKIFPIDSEHSAIWQILLGEDKKNINKIILTCSGGPFFGKTKKELKNVTISNVLNHPVWQMGKKISVDSATLMNKGFEVIEASYLFGIEPEKIEVVIHPEGIIHSLVEFCDGSIKAQLAVPDMRLPIQYALTYPERKTRLVKRLNLIEIKKLNFYKPDFKNFPCFLLAIKALKIGGTMLAALNASNEEAVRLFLERKIKFLDIYKINKQIIEKHKIIKNPTLEDILKIDKKIKKEIRQMFN